MPRRDRPTARAPQPPVWPTAIATALCLGIGAYAVAGSMKWVPPIHYAWLMGAVVLLSCCAIPWGTAHHRSLAKVRRAAQERDGAMCTICHYPLSAEEEWGHCPECGEVFSRAENRRFWGLESLFKPPPPKD